MQRGKKNVEIDNICFELKVEKIQHVIYPKLTDQFVKGKLGCDSLEAYKEQLKDKIYQIKLELELDNVKSNLRVSV